jgi:hypothetical protein
MQLIKFLHVSYLKREYLRLEKEVEILVLLNQKYS